MKKELLKFSHVEFMKKYNVSVSTVYKYKKLCGLGKKWRSVLEETIDIFLTEQEFEFIANTKKIIKPYELDFYLPEHNLAIEVCGSYWHSEAVLKKKKKKSPSQYHRIKFNLCKDVGINLITLFDKDFSENEQEVKDLLLFLIEGKKPAKKSGRIYTEIDNFIKKRNTIKVDLRYGLSLFYLNNDYGIKEEIPPMISEYLSRGDKIKVWDCGHYIMEKAT